MHLKRLVQLFSFVLAINFAGQVVFTVSPLAMCQIEIDIDADAEKEEHKSEKETDKLNHKQMLSNVETLREGNLLSIHNDHWWISPTIEISDPPPELG